MIKGLQSIAFKESPYLVSSASVAGKKEGEGPLGKMFDMVEEVGMANVKIGLDLPLFDHQTEAFIYETVRRAGKDMAHSHTLGVGIKYGPSDSIYATEEVVPGDGIENWVPFFKACKEIGYEGYFAYEQCAPFFVKGHRKPDVADVDERQKKGFAFIKSLEEKI